MFVSEFDSEITDVDLIWRPVEKSLRPSGERCDVGSPGRNLFIIKQDWRIEVVSLDDMGKFDIRELDVQEPMLFSELG